MLYGEERDTWCRGVLPRRSRPSLPQIRYVGEPPARCVRRVRDYSQVIRRIRMIIPMIDEGSKVGV